MKKNEIDPDGMLKTNLEIFSDLGKWLTTSGGMWMYLFGIFFACITFLARFLGAENIKDTKGLINSGLGMAIIGGGLLFIRQFREFTKKALN